MPLCLSTNTIIHRSSGQLEMKLSLDGATCNHGIMHGLILLPFRYQDHQMTIFGNSVIKKYSKICDLVQLFFYL